MPIRILPVNVSSQISAGEIIIEPSSVVKELMENSIDAGAKNIYVNIEKGGLQLILVQDDGIGIKKKELFLAISRHATSKMFLLKDLNFINTFGFRGEALASIRAVSRFTIVSSTLCHEYAWKIYSEGYDNKYIDIKAIAHPVGTSVLVEDLFYNIPVRLKFIQSIKKEYLKIYSIFNKIALSHFNINFLLRHNQKIVAQYSAISKKNIKIQRLAQMFHSIDVNKLLEIQSEYKKIKLFGWMSLPRYDFSLKKNQYFYVNNRYVHDNTINCIFSSAYKYYLGKKNSFFFVLYIFLPFNKVDINIHPTKSEIKFHDENIVYKFIYKSIIDALKKYFFINKSQNNIIFYEKNIYNTKLYNSFEINHSNINIKQQLKKKISNIDASFKKKLHIINIKNNIFGKLLVIVRQYYGLIQSSDNFLLISFPFAKKLVSQCQLKKNIENNIIPVLILTNIKMNITFLERSILMNHMESFLKLGINLILKNKYIIIKTLPTFLQQEDIIKTMFNIIQYLNTKKDVSLIEIIDWFYMNISTKLNHWSYVEGLSILLEIERSYPFLFMYPPSELLQKININSALRVLKI